MFKHNTINQIVLPLNLEINFEKTDSAFAANDLVESIPERAFEDFARSTIGCPAYHPRMMMKITLCGIHSPYFRVGK